MHFGCSYYLIGISLIFWCPIQKSCVKTCKITEEEETRIKQAKLDYDACQYRDAEVRFRGGPVQVQEGLNLEPNFFCTEISSIAILKKYLLHS